MGTDDTTPDGTAPATVPDTANATPGGPVLNLSGAVRVAGVSRSTMQRRLRDGAIPGAVRIGDPDTGAWAIPYVGLVAAGMVDTTTPADTPPKVDPAAELAAVRVELADERARRMLAEALAAERAERITDLHGQVADLRRQLPPAPADTAAPAPRRRWWGRG